MRSSGQRVKIIFHLYGTSTACKDGLAHFTLMYGSLTHTVSLNQSHLLLPQNSLFSHSSTASLQSLRTCDLLCLTSIYLLHRTQAAVSIFFFQTEAYGITLHCLGEFVSRSLVDEYAAKRISCQAWALKSETLVYLFP